MEAQLQHHRYESCSHLCDLSRLYPPSDSVTWAEYTHVGHVEPGSKECDLSVTAMFVTCSLDRLCCGFPAANKLKYSQIAYLTLDKCVSGRQWALPNRRRQLQPHRWTS